MSRCLSKMAGLSRQRSIADFLGTESESAEDVDSGQNGKEPDAAPSVVVQRKKPKVLASAKTVRKWEKELNISLGYSADSSNTITEIWCLVCRENSPDRSSSVSFI